MNSRERFSLIALLVLPLLAFGYAVVQEFGTAEDFARLNLVGADGGALLAQVHRGLVNSALLETSFLHATAVSDLMWIRGLTMVLAALTGVAIWQLLERGGWAEFDAAAAGLCVALLPSVQVIVGSATAWPMLLAGLLSLAGFAAIESELERGGLKRAVGMLGGVMLYLTSSLVYFPSAVMGVAPLAGVLLLRPKRLWGEHQKWLLMHTGVMLAGIVGGWMLERWLLEDVGLLASMKAVDFGARLQGFFAMALPGALGAFLPHWLLPGGAVTAWLAALAVATVLWLAMKKESAENDTAPQKWARTFIAGLGLIVLSVFMAPDWHPGYQLLLPFGALVAVCLIAALRVVVAPGKKTLTFFYVGLGALVLVCTIAAGYSARTQIANPLALEWERVSAAVGRATLGDKPVIFIATGETQAAGPGFNPTALRQAGAAERMCRAALSERFGEQVLKKKIEFRTGPAPVAGEKYDLLIDVAALGR